MATSSWPWSAEHYRKTGSLRGGGVVATQMSNLALERYLATLGLGLVRTQVGDRYVVEHMRSHGYNVGGEQSGHIILTDYATTGDGLIAALQVLGAIVEAGRPASDVCRRFHPLPQFLKNVACDGRKVLSLDPVRAAIADGERRLGDAGRLLIRRSGTEPKVRVMAEGEDEVLTLAVVDDIVREIERHVD